MSFSVGVSGSRDEIVSQLRESFDNSYSPPAPGVEEIFDLGVSAVEDFLNDFSDEGNYSVSVSGHAKQGELDRSSMQMSINAVS